MSVWPPEEPPPPGPSGALTAAEIGGILGCLAVILCGLLAALTSCRHSKHLIEGGAEAEAENMSRNLQNNNALADVFDGFDTKLHQISNFKLIDCAKLSID